MALFLDSAELDEIRSGMELGIYSGVTTNPGLLKNLRPEDRLDRFAEIAKICPKSIYLQVSSKSISEMENQALTYVEVAPGRTIIKVPMGADGLKLCGQLKTHSVPACITAVFTPTQAYAAACAGAHAVAIYVGRITKSGADGLAVVRQVADMFAAGELSTSILAASIPDVDSLTQILSVPGVDATIPYRLQESLLHSKGTLEAIEEFTAAARGSKI
jgi:transaldolase